jgi:hypothetical protein
MANASESKNPYSSTNTTVCYPLTTNHCFTSASTSDHYLTSASGAKDGSPPFQRWVE